MTTLLQGSGNLAASCANLSRPRVSEASGHRKQCCGGEGWFGGAACGFDGEAEGDLAGDGSVDDLGQVAGGQTDRVGCLRSVDEPELPGAVRGEFREISQYDDCRVRSARHDDCGLAAAGDRAVDGAGVGFGEYGGDPVVGLDRAGLVAVLVDRDPAGGRD